MRTVTELKELKIRLGYSNARLSDESGIPLGTVNKIFSGETTAPRYKSLEALERALVTADIRSIQMQTAKSIEYKYKHAPKDSLIREEAVAYGFSDMKGPGDFTISDYEQMSDEHRVELIDGILYDMAAPSIRHQDMVLTIASEIRSVIRKKKGECRTFVSPIDVQLDEEDEKTIVQPDILIVCDHTKIREQRIVGAPDFIAEVVSPSSQSRDYYKKAYKYEQCGVREYWVVNPMNENVTIYEFEKGTPIRIVPLEGKLKINVIDGEIEFDQV